MSDDRLADLIDSFIRDEDDDEFDWVSDEAAFAAAAIRAAVAADPSIVGMERVSAAADMRALVATMRGVYLGPAPSEGEATR